jgi:hypothetical protein
MQKHFGRLRLAEIAALQEAMEREYGAWELLLVERQQDAASGRVTQGFHSKVRTHSSTLRKLYRAWAHWQSRGGAGGARMEASEEQVLQGAFPWEPTAQGSSSKDALELALFKVVSELFRSKEELEFLKSDCSELLSYYTHQRHVLLERAREHGASWSPGHAFLVLCKLREIRTQRDRVVKAHGAMMGNL